MVSIIWCVLPSSPYVDSDIWRSKTICDFKVCRGNGTKWCKNLNANIHVITLSPPPYMFKEKRKKYIIMSQRALYFHMQPGILENNHFSVIACLKSPDCNWMHRSIYHRFMFLCYFILELSSIMSGKSRRLHAALSQKALWSWPAASSHDMKRPFPFLHFHLFEQWVCYESESA